MSCHQKRHLSFWETSIILHGTTTLHDRNLHINQPYGDSGFSLFMVIHSWQSLILCFKGILQHFFLDDQTYNNGNRSFVVSLCIPTLNILKPYLKKQKDPRKNGPSRRSSCRAGRHREDGNHQGPLQGTGFAHRGVWKPGDAGEVRGIPWEIFSHKFHFDLDLKSLKERTWKQFADF